MSLSRELEFKVKHRAGERCEYCLMHQALQGASFHIEHIVPRSAGGHSVLTNLALACPACNLHKADRVNVLDEESGKTLPLFNPRTDVWADHFAFEGYVIVGLSPVGRATLHTLDFNNPRRLKIREAETLFDLFPPS